MKKLQGVGHNYSKNIGSKAYKIWAAMINRCYGTSHGCYDKVRVCDLWHDFEQFNSWVAGKDFEGKELDKDIIDPSARTYSPETCVFVTQEVNKLTSNWDGRGEFMKGVSFHRGTGKFRARITHKNKRVSLGLYDSEELACLAHLKAKIEVAIFHMTHSDSDASLALSVFCDRVYREYKEIEVYYKQKLK